MWSKRTWQEDGKAVEKRVAEGNKLVKYTPEQAGELEKSLDKSGDSGIIEEIKQTGILGEPHIPPKTIDTSKLSINDEHIELRKHNVTSSEAHSFIENADVSLTKWNGRFENYYGSSGAAFVDLKNNEIKTAFKSDEYDAKATSMMKVIEKWKKK